MVPPVRLKLWASRVGIQLTTRPHKTPGILEEATWHLLSIPRGSKGQTKITKQTEEGWWRFLPFLPYFPSKKINDIVRVVSVLPSANAYNLNKSVLRWVGATIS